MAEIIRYQIGDIVRMKKGHPCGGDQWEITRTGMDFGLKCTTCGRRVMISRVNFEKGCKGVVQQAKISVERKREEEI